jgi:hypothetical protein
MIIDPTEAAIPSAALPLFHDDRGTTLTRTRVAKGGEKRNE